MKTMYYPNPGVLPTKPAPTRDEMIEFSVLGLPPFKEVRRSIRNPKRPMHEAFVRLREAATAIMNQRECYSGPIGLYISLYAPKLERPLIDYLGGIQDTLDGSHGPGFTYLPICYQDDRQVAAAHVRFVESVDESYAIGISFL